jgi:hypothetical protein
MIKWDEELIFKLENIVKRPNLWRVELRGRIIEEVRLEDPAVRFKGDEKFIPTENFIPLEEFHPQEFKIYRAAPIENWWEQAFFPNDTYDRLFGENTCAS